MSTGGDYLKLPLPEKMRLAAIVLEECDERHGNDEGLGWRYENLLYLADKWETEDEPNICKTCRAHYDKHSNDDLSCPAYTGADGSVVFSDTHHFAASKSDNLT